MVGTKVMDPMFGLWVDSLSTEALITVAAGSRRSSKGDVGLADRTPSSISALH